LKPKILLIEDECDIQELLQYNLEREGFELASCHEGATGLEMARKFRPDLILLDVMIPGIGGKEVCRRLKADAFTEQIPVIFLTARSEDIDKMIGFELGADDYVTKPFSPRELIARIRAVLKRVLAEPTRERVLIYGDLQIDFLKRQVSFADVSLSLSALEFEIFYLLVSHPSRVFTRDELLTKIWKDESFVTPRTVDVHIRRLRSKYAAVPGFPACIKTFRGVGYKFEWPS
jgi:two-component system alkaline phosphatase synthesis response regulator PhoP